MQTYPLKLSAAASQAMFSTRADLFVYESGDSAGDTRILVKPDSGGEIALRPGQRFRLPPGEKASQWLVRVYTTGATIDGTIIIGSGDFDDANTNNIVTLSESFSNTVLVSNSGEGQAIPVSLTGTKINNTTAERIPVSLDEGQLASLEGQAMAYTKAWTHNAVLAGNTSVQIMAPAENTNGAILHVFKSISKKSGGGDAFMTLLAKNGAPISLTDGDVLMAQTIPVDYANAELPHAIRVPAGRGLYLYASAAEGGNALRNALLTIL